MMFENNIIDVKGLQSLVAYLLQNQNNINEVITEFGEVIKDNGYGTVFLKPKNPLFKVVWLYQQNGKIESVGFGGIRLGLTLNDLYSFYNGYKESFSRYEDEYVYGFFSEKYPTHIIKVSSPDKLMDGSRIINNIEIKEIEIMLKSMNS